MKKELDRLSLQLQQSLAEQKKLEEKIEENIRIRDETFSMQRLVQFCSGIYEPGPKREGKLCDCGFDICASIEELKDKIRAIKQTEANSS